MSSNTNFTERHFRSVVGRFPTGVTVVTTQNPDNNAPMGITISSFHSLSLEPPLILWTLTKKATTLQNFLAADSYVVHILSASQQDLANRFASGSQQERFNGLNTTQAPGGSLMLDDPLCAAWLECTNIKQHEAGDHFIFVGQVTHCEYQLAAPLVYHAGEFELTPAAQTLPEHPGKSIIL